MVPIRWTVQLSLTAVAGGETFFPWTHFPRVLHLGASLDIASSADLGAQNGGDFRFHQNRTGNTAIPTSTFVTASSSVICTNFPSVVARPLLGNAPRAEQPHCRRMADRWHYSVLEGNWFTVLDSNSFANSDGQSRPDVIGDPLRSVPCQRNPDPHCQLTLSHGGLAADRTRVLALWVNACAFTDPPFGSFGDVGRNTVQGPGYQIWDFSLFKNFPISERTKLEFRAEFFNVFNHPNLQFAKSGPQNSINTTTFGTPEFGFLTAARDPRQIQFALKLSF